VLAIVEALLLVRAELQAKVQRHLFAELARGIQREEAGILVVHGREYGLPQVKMAKARTA
jgi:hypothetical protein